MRSVPSLLSMLGEPDRASPVIMPWTYVRMRREAARLSIAQVARHFWTRPEHQYDVERHFRDLETEGLRFKRVYRTEGQPYFFSHDVYHQLSNLPPHQHPRLCTRCAWDEHSQQYDHDGNDTRWSTEDPAICTRCEQQLSWERDRSTPGGDRHAA
ncbi:hypothetical protein [Sphingobium abikonense]|uniref:hypothetical protein n=1 Tax=Sphingobium abikonense TaxID=86193 RepID=UPI002E86E3F6|nr:hypothetical protein [Pseudomonadota bacterium]